MNTRSRLRLGWRKGPAQLRREKIERLEKRLLREGIIVKTPPKETMDAIDYILGKINSCELYEFQKQFIRDLATSESLEIQK